MGCISTEDESYHLPFPYSDNTEVVKKKTSEAKKLLDRWHTSYLEMRLKIEMMGRDARWEFDRKKLFEHTDYMAMVCGDLHEMAEVCGMT